MSYVYVLFTILLTVYSQLVIKWRVGLAGALPDEIYDKILFLLQLLFTPWVMSAFAAALLAGVAWMAAMTRLPLSYAYPFTSLAFVLVILLSAVFFREPITAMKVAGIVLVILGIAVGSQG